MHVCVCVSWGRAFNLSLMSGNTHQETSGTSDAAGEAQTGARSLSA